MSSKRPLPTVKTEPVTYSSKKSKDATTSKPISNIDGHVNQPYNTALPYSCPRVVLRLMQLIRRYSDEPTKTSNKKNGTTQKQLSSSRIVDHLLDIVKQHLEKLNDEEKLMLVWDVLGRLLGILLMQHNHLSQNKNDGCDSWKTRTIAGEAMEEIAKLLPHQDKVRLLQENTALALDWSTLRQVLATAKPLLARNDDEEDDDEERGGAEQYYEDTDSVGENDPSSPEFVQRRIAWQRKILHRRLGLTLLSAVVDKGTEDISQGILAPEDVAPIQRTSPTTKRSPDQQVCSKRQRLETVSTFHHNINTTSGALDEDESEHPLSLRSLLLAQLQRSSNTSRPQEIVIHELLLHMLDPSWQVRHGALIGTLALLRACWNGGVLLFCPKEEDSDSSETSSWPTTVLYLSLFILARDCFGDFSSSGIGSDDWTLLSSSYHSNGSMVAPVRELAGQVVALLWMSSKPNMQRDTLRWLLDRGRYSEQIQKKEWEIRHGSLTASKYIMALLLNCPNSNKFETDSNLYHAKEQMIQAALDALSDESDDVKSVASQLLLQYYSHQNQSTMGAKDLNASMLLVFNAITQAKAHSSCLMDLVALLSIMVQQCDSYQQLSHAHVLDTLIKLLDSDFASVRQSALVCIKFLIIPMASKFAAQRSTGVEADAVNECQSSSKFLPTFICLIEKLFATYYIWQEDNNIGPDLQPLERIGVDDNARICITRDSVWKELAQASQTVFGKNKDWKTLEEHLVLQYFGINNPQLQQIHTTTSFSIQSRTASALGIFLCHLNAVSHPLIQFSLEAFLQSPWAFQCEAALLLLREIILLHSTTSSDICNDSHVSHLLKELNGMLDKSTPPCLAMDPALWDTLDNPTLIIVRDQAFCFAISDIENAAVSINQRVDSVVQIWHKAFHLVKKEEMVANSVLSMRVKAIIAGTMLADDLPSKLTPIIRALITSLKNEESSIRLNTSCIYLSELLLAIQERHEFDTAKQKVLDTVCKMALNESNTTPYCSEQPGSLVLHYVISKMKPDKATIKVLKPLWHRLEPLLIESIENGPTEVIDDETLVHSIHLLEIVGESLCTGNVFCERTIPDFITSLTRLACHSQASKVHKACLSALKPLCLIDQNVFLRQLLVNIMPHLKDQKCDLLRCNACSLLEAIVLGTDTDVSPFVRSLLPCTMSLMTDPIEECALKANRIFAALVQLAPLVQQQKSILLQSSSSQDDCVIDHLLLGKPLPQSPYPKVIEDALSNAGIVLRNYQREGISWLCFLQAVKLNGALCDSMGLGKTIQALIAVAVSHYEISQSLACSEGMGVKSLIVCPATLVGHWRAEIEKFFPDQDIFRTLCLNGNKAQRALAWSEVESANIVVTSYSVLRAEVNLLCEQDWVYCVLDEGHLLKNPTTATSKASRRLRARHKLILTGTPVQNRVNELWATFNFLMPNFLGSSSSFAKEFARPISNSQLPGATAAAIGEGIEKLKILHQQVLPFILRREKEDVLKELPPKIVSIIKVPMSKLQAKIYSAFCSSESSRASIDDLQRALQTSQSSSSRNLPIGSQILKSLLFLRLLCTHPLLVAEVGAAQDSEEWRKMGSSGKLLALIDILNSAGINENNIAAADNDTSLVYCDNLDGECGSSYDKVLTSMQDSGLGPETEVCSSTSGRKCVIFAQFTKSLDIVEDLVFKPHMPSLHYLRLDGQVPSERRASVANRFNNDPTIKALLATTRIGGLGLNLTGADTVIFLENDYNPFADLQAMDRAHRIGQKKTVNVYRLVTEESIEEKIIDLQEKKIAVSDAIVNTENSSMYSMGTDRLLDIFAFRTSQEGSGTAGNDDTGPSFDLDALFERYSEDYAGMSIDKFLKSLQ